MFSSLNSNFQSLQNTQSKAKVLIWTKDEYGTKADHNLSENVWGA